jgi:virginiamycin A acetyltransferase
MDRIIRTMSRFRGAIEYRLRFKTLEGGTTVARDVIGLRNVRFAGESHVRDGCRFSGEIDIGWRTTIGPGCYLMGEVSTGKYCTLGPQTAIHSRNHPLAHLTTHTFGNLLGGLMRRYNTGDPVRIGNDVWTGFRSVILHGVQIGNGAVIGAGAVVTGSVPPYAIVAGVPARVVGYRFDRELIPLIESLGWWDMSDAELEEIRWLFEMDLVAEKETALRRLKEMRSSSETQDS